VPGQNVPVTLSRFFHEGRPTPLVVVTLPVAPKTHQVEALVRDMGLSSSEARVVALIQLGLSNKAAAVQAGLSEHTFNTYAKRVLSKLNISCRAEWAQLLTWQASGRRGQ